MRVFKNNEELKSLIVEGNITINDDIECYFDINVEANIKAHNIKAWNIKANNIDSCDIKAYNIKANNIDSCDIKAYNIDSHNIDSYNIDSHNIDSCDIKAININACNIKANNINACDIKANNIDAYDISYHAFCISYRGLICESIKGRRSNSFHNCLDGEVTIKEKLKELLVNNITFNLNKEEINSIKNQLK
jgi:hypothetical protein